MFAYCLNNPVMYSDPSGYAPTITAADARLLLRISSGLASNPYGVKVTSAHARAALQYSSGLMSYSELASILPSQVLKSITINKATEKNESRGYGYAILSGIRSGSDYLFYKKEDVKAFNFIDKLPDAFAGFIASIKDSADGLLGAGINFVFQSLAGAFVSHVYKDDNPYQGDHGELISGATKSFFSILRGPGEYWKQILKYGN